MPTFGGKYQQPSMDNSGPTRVGPETSMQDGFVAFTPSPSGQRMMRGLSLPRKHQVAGFLTKEKKRRSKEAWRGHFLDPRLCPSAKKVKRTKKKKFISEPAIRTIYESDSDDEVVFIGTNLTMKTVIVPEPKPNLDIRVQQTKKGDVPFFSLMSTPAVDNESLKDSDSGDDSDPDWKLPDLDELDTMAAKGLEYSTYLASEGLTVSDIANMFE